MNTQRAPVVVTAIDDGFQVAVKGAIQTNVGGLDGEWKRLVGQKPKKIELDLSSISFLSTSEIGTLLAFRKGITTNGGTLRITAIQKQVLSILRYTHLVEAFGAQNAAILETAT